MTVRRCVYFCAVLVGSYARIRALRALHLLLLLVGGEAVLPLLPLLLKGLSISLEDEVRGAGGQREPFLLL